MDVESAFLIDNLEEEVYVEQLADFVVKEEEEKVCRLKKTFYGLKQASRAWNFKLMTIFHKKDSQDAFMNMHYM